LGFTLGGFALLLGFGDERFRSLLADKEKDEKSSIYTSLCATFVHFIVLQLLALIFAIITNALQFQVNIPSYLLGFFHMLTAISYAFGYGLFIYSLLSLLAATLAIFRAATWYETYQQKQKDANDENNN
jgi:large-conductance mechanosensitive channel